VRSDAKKREQTRSSACEGDQFDDDDDDDDDDDGDDDGDDGNGAVCEARIYRRQ
jgi:hypothetical protein